MTGENLDSGYSDKIITLIVSLRYSAWVDGQRFQVAEGPRLRKPGSPSATEFEEIGSLAMVYSMALPRTGLQETGTSSVWAELDELRGHRVEQEHCSEAAEMIGNSLQVLRSALGEGHEYTAVALSNSCKLCLRPHDLERADAYLSQSMTTHETCGGGRSLNAVFAANRYGDVRIEQGDTRKRKCC